MINTCKSNPCCGNFRDCTEALLLPAQVMTPTDNLEAGAGDLVERYAARADELSEGGQYQWWSGLAELLRSQAAQLSAVTAENARLRERIEQAYKAGFDFAMLTEAPK